MFQRLDLLQSTDEQVEMQTLSWVIYRPVFSHRSRKRQQFQHTELSSWPSTCKNVLSLEQETMDKL